MVGQAVLYYEPLSGRWSCKVTDAATFEGGIASTQACYLDAYVWRYGLASPRGSHRSIPVEVPPQDLGGCVRMVRHVLDERRVGVTDAFAGVSPAAQLERVVP